MKALIVKIRNASFFKEPQKSGSQDKMVDINGKVSRFNKRNKECTPYIKVPAGQLCIYHVANLLRALWGERPIPTNRKVHALFKGDDYFINKAKETHIRIFTPIITPKKEGKDRHYPEEILTVRKSIGDSWQTAKRTYFLDEKEVQIKGGLLYPDRLRRFIGKELYDKFIEICALYGNIQTIQEGIELLNKNKEKEPVISFCIECVANKKTSLSNMILNKSADSNTIHATPSIPLNLIMSCGSIEKIEKFDAVLFIPVTDKDIKCVEEYTGVASYLESGYASIEALEDWSRILEINTTKPVEGEKICF